MYYMHSAYPAMRSYQLYVTELININGLNILMHAYGAFKGNLITAMPFCESTKDTIE